MIDLCTITLFVYSSMYNGSKKLEELTYFHVVLAPFHIVHVILLAFSCMPLFFALPSIPKTIQHCLYTHRKTHYTRSLYFYHIT